MGVALSIGFADMPTALRIAGLLALVLSGAIFFAASLQFGQEALARRSSLAMPPGRALAPRKKPAKPKPQQMLFRMPGQRELSNEQRLIVLYMSKLGIPIAHALMSFAAARLLAAIALGAAAALGLRYIPALAASVVLAPFAAVCAAMVGWLLPSVWLRVNARQRGAEVGAGLPEALDLIVVCLDAGLSLEDALARVVTELSRPQPALADELAMMSADLQILPSREEALQKMADRVDLPSVRAFVTTLTQTLRYGTPLSQALRTIAAELRNDALLQLEERANQLPALLTVPLMLFIMPTIFLIIGGPAVLQLLDVWGR